MTPKESRQCLETVLVVRPARMLLHVVKASDSANYLAMSRMAPTIKNYPSQNINSVSIEKPQANARSMAESRQWPSSVAGKGQEDSY